MSGGGSAGTSYQTNNSNSSSGPPTEIAWALNELAGQRYGQFQANPNAPAYYPGQTVADQSAYTRQGLSNLFNAGGGTPTTTAGNSNLVDTLTGKYLNIGNNPYFQNALQSGFDAQNTSFLNSVLPSLRSQFQGAGRTGSGADFDTAMRATNDLSRAQASAAAAASAGQYDAERQRQMGALGLVPGYQQSALAGAQAQAAAGQTQDAYQQALIDADIAKYNYNQNAQGDYLTRVAQQLQSIYPGGTTSGTSYSSGNFMQPGMGTGGWLGGGLGLGGLLLQGFAKGGALAGLFSSDQRDKTDIKELGIDPLTGLKMYAYRYKGDPKTYPKVVGPMAQDIEAAGGPVREIGGHKVVGGLV